ncbi:MAG: sigma-54 dependent transcriptional regulator [Desulfobacterota bacterium]|nr:sigma-54 dependent transcriptional regulator [Thermodesulfobacteriota bacterium]
MQTTTVLVIDPDEACRAALAGFLKPQGYTVIEARDADSSISMLQTHHIDIILTELRLPRIDGYAFLKKLKTDYAAVPVLVVTGSASVSVAVKAMKTGAEDFLTKPVNSEELHHLLQAILAKKTQQRRAQKAECGAVWYEGIIGSSPAMKKVYQLIDKLAAVDSTVIVYGESGTGKELVARAIHAKSRRAQHPLIPVNCGAIPAELLESELFGHEKGSFTSAYRTRIGRFELAKGGTIFLDEIGDMSPVLQVKLLRVLQEHEFERVGGTKPIKTDIRVIAATHRDLEKAVAEGKFREDLYYRLNVVPIYLPPLRERPTDIPLLVKHFISRFSSEKGKPVETITDRAMECFLHYHWPGNVRELQNIIERVVILNESGVIDCDDLPEKMVRQQRSHLNTPPSSLPSEQNCSFATMVTNFERQLILQALERSAGVKNKAAQLLNINRTTLVEKMKKLNISTKG